MQTTAETDEFDEIIGKLARVEPLDPRLLPDLLLSFIDDTEHQEVMWSLLHHVEDYPAEFYVAQLVAALPHMSPHAREWALLLLGRTLNSNACRPLLRVAWQALSGEHQHALAALFDELVQQAPARASHVAEVTHGTVADQRHR